MNRSQQFQAALLRWYAANKRAMPWRGTRDAYRVWLSEVMLQQTRVAAVEDYYRRFVRRFPTVQSLARARSEKVMRHWAGLGYYSRARNLHRAAKAIVAKHDGEFPRTFDEALALPGVGRYTAAAVLSIAYGQPHAVLDGNVARVLARVFAIRGDLRAPKRWKRLQELADDLLSGATPRTETNRLEAGAMPGEWNQAMMELGATVCTPRGPRCEACPVAQFCRARKMGIAEQLPAKRGKRATEKVTIAAAVLLDRQGRTALIKQSGGLFSGMWQFPAVTVNGGDPRVRLAEHWAPQDGTTKDLTQRKKRGAEGAEKDWQELPAARHTVTFREITLRAFLKRVAELPPIAGSRAVRLTKLDSLAVSSATRKIARRAEEALAGKS